MPLQSTSGHHPTQLFWYLGFHGNAILNFNNTSKASTHYGEYSYDVSWSLMKQIKFFFLNPPFFYFLVNCAKFVLPILNFLAYLIPLDVDVTRNITAKICEVWSEFNIFCTLVTMATAAILNLFNPPKYMFCHQFMPAVQ